MADTSSTKFGDATLRGYQAESVANFLDRPGCLIAYDKRGGKTITSLALTERRLEQGAGPILVISDKTEPWQDNFALAGLPGERLHLLETSSTWFKWLLEEPAPSHYYVVHWAAIVPMFKLLGSITWHTVIADEVHHAKNHRAQRSIGLKHIRAKYKVGLTADPDDDVPHSMWSLLNWIYPKRYSSYWRWVYQNFRVSEESNYKTGHKYKVIGEPTNAAALREEIKPFFIKLSLKEIDPGQPDDVFVEVLVDMTAEQRAAYEQMVDWQMMELGEEIVIASYSIAKASRLQQMAQSYGITEIHQLWRWVTEYDQNGDEIRVRRQIESIRIRQTEPSPKLDSLLGMINSGDLGPTIVYSQFPGMLDLARKRLDAASLPYIFVESSDEVRECSRAFQRGDADLILGTVWRIGESIKLSRADTVIFLDCPWNPRVRGQAIARPREVGRRRGIRVIDIRTRDSVDMVRLSRTRTKQEWREAFLGDRGTI